MKLFSTILSTVISLCSFAQQQKFMVHFDFDRADLSRAEIQKLDSFINAAGRPVVILHGHTDSKGSTEYNLALSQRRVSTVRSYLLKIGYPEDFIKQAWHGEEVPIADDGGDKRKGAINRRVEILWEKLNVVETKMEAMPPSPKKSNDTRSIQEQIEDTAVQKGTALVLENMNFEGGRHRILPSSLAQLRSLLQALENNPKLRIALEGHICCLEGDADGMDFDTQTPDLSFQRAKAIYEYLVYSGIDKNRIQYRGFGHSVPLFPFPEKTPEERTANRRVEIRILDK